MNTLQEHHKKNFTEVNARLGLDSQKHVLKASSNDVFAKKDVIVFGADKANSDIVGKVVPVASIAELKRLSGIPSNVDDAHVDYPAPMTKMLKGIESLQAEGISDDLKDEIAKAASSYVLGQPDKVKDYEKVINTTMFPGKALLFAVDNLYIKSGQTVVLGTSGEPEIYNFGTITIEQGGLLSVVGNVQLTCQVFTQL